jgi:hypothetical protein
VHAPEPVDSTRPLPRFDPAPMDPPLVDASMSGWHRAA